MSSSFFTVDYTPSISESFALQNQIEKTLQKHPKSHITDFFILKSTKGSGFDLVRKKSFKGRWIRFKAACAKFCKRPSSLDVYENLNKVHILFERMRKAQSSDFETVACDQQVSVDELHNKIKNLSDILDQVKQHVIEKNPKRKASFSKFNFKSHAKKTVYAAKRILPAQDEKKQLTDFIQQKLRLDPSIASETADVLLEHEDKKQLVEDLLDFNLSPDEMQSRLTVALFDMQKGLPKEDTKAQKLQQLLKRLSEVEIENFSGAPIQLKNVAMVLGDAFIAESDLEGGVNTIPYAELAVECIENLGLISVQATALKQSLQDGISLFETKMTAKQLQEKVVKNIEKLSQGHQRCILYGGWIGHAVVYEIEKGKNNRYSFRVYNEGEGIHFHDKVASAYKDRFSGCIAICDIAEQDIINTSFLGALQSLAGIQKEAKPAEILVNKLIPLLGGKKEEIDPRFQRYVSPQRSGTCTYRSLQAYFAHVLPANEYKRFKCEYKLFLLDKYRTQMQRNMRNITSENYQARRQECTLFTLSLAKFAGGIAKLEPVLSKEKITQARIKITEYESLLKQYDDALIAFEKDVYASETTTILAKTQRLIDVEQVPEYPGLEVAESKPIVQASRVADALTDLMQKIEALDSGSATFSTDVQQCVTRLAGAIRNKELPFSDFVYAYDAFCKKMKNLDAWKNIQSNMLYMKNLHTIVHHLVANANNQGIMFHRVELYTMAFVTYFGLESAYRKLPSNQRVFQESFPTFLTHLGLGDNGIRDPISQLHAIDPFWSNTARELENETNPKKPESLVETPASALGGIFRFFQSVTTGVAHEVRESRESPYPLPEISTPNEIDTASYSQYEPSNTLLEEINRWLNASEQAELKQKIAISVIQDRHDQEVEVARRIKIEEKNIKHYRQELTILLPQLEELERTRPSEISDLQWANRNVEQIETRISDSRQERGVDHRLEGLYHELHEARRARDQIAYRVQPWLTRYNHVVEGVNRYKEGIYQAELNITNMPETVSREPQYWPKKFEKKIISQQLYSADFELSSVGLSFLFGQDLKFFQQKLGVSSVIPQEMRLLFDAATLTMHMPWRQTYESIPSSIAVDTYRNFYDGTITLQNERYNQFQRPDQKEFFSEYSRDFTSNDFRQAYKKICEMKECPETSIPAYYAKECSTIAAISEQQMKELLALHRSPIQLDALLLYFSEHVDLLVDHNWFLLFHSFLFESHFLLEALQDPDLAKNTHQKLHDFFQTTLAHALESEQYALAANLTWTASSVQKFIQFTQPKREPPVVLHPIIEPSFVITLMDAISDPAFADQWPSAFEALTASIHNFGIDTADSTFLAYALFVHILGLHFSNNTEPCTLRREQAVDTAQDIRKLFCSKACPQVQDLFQKCLPIGKKIFPNIFTESVSWKESRGVISSQDNTVQISLSTGQLQVGSPEKLRVYKNPLPDYVARELEHRCIYDPGSDFSKVRTYSEGDVIYIRDSERNLFFAFSDNEVYAKIGTHYGRFIPISERDYLRENLELKTHYLHYQIGDTIYLCNYAHTPLYMIQNGRVTTVKTPQYTLVSSPTSQVFSRFEAENRTLFFADKSNTIQKIDFCRLGISFSRNAKGDFELDQQKGWCLAKEQFAPLFGPKTGYLVVENAKGEKKVLLPVWDAIAEEGKQALSFSYAYDFCAKEVDDGHFVECDLKGSILVPKTFEARLYLARIYLEKGAYEKAETLLFSHKASTNTRRLSDNEAKMLEKMTYVSLSKSTSGPALRLRLHALYLLEHSAWAFPSQDKQKRQQYPEYATKLFSMYLNRLGHISPIPKDEELFLLNEVMLSQSDVPAFKYRKAELEGKTPLTELSLSEPFHEPSHVQPVKAISLPEDKKSRLCTASEKNEYVKCRKEHIFPFDHTQLYRSSEEKKFYQYLPLIMKECKEVENIEKCRESGLLHMLYYLYLFGPPEFRNDAQALLSIVQEKVSTLPLLHTPTQTQEERQKIQLRIAEGISQLPTLPVSALASDISTFLQNMSEQFFEEQKVEKAPVETSIFAKTSYEITSPAVEKQFSSTQKDLEAAKERLQIKNYQLKKDQDVTALRDNIQQRFDDETQNLGRLEGQIMMSVTMALTHDPVSALSFSSKKRTLPTIQELCILSARADGADLIKKTYPELSSDGVTRLQEALKDYLQQKRFVQHLNRSLEHIDLYVSAKEHERQVFLDALNQQLQAPDTYSMDDSFATCFLVVETILNIKLRSDQVQNIKRFKENIDGKQDIVMQMIMGSGKTAILQPILAFLFAKPDFISTVTIPEALFKSVLLGLSDALGSTFGQVVFTIGYSRQEAKDITYLDTVYKRLLEAKEQRACVLMTPRQKHSIVTSLYESYYEYIQAKKEGNLDKIEQVRGRLTTISKICQALELEEIAQVDEVDLVMNPEVIFKYPVGHRAHVDETRASFVSELLLKLAFDEDVHKSVSIDFVDKLWKRLDPESKAKGAAISPLIYLSTVKPKLVELAIELLSSKIEWFSQLISQDTNNYIQHFLSQSTPYDDKIMAQCLPGEEEQITARLLTKTQNLTEIETLIQQKIAYKKAMLAWIEKNIPSNEAKDLLGVSSKAICTTLKESLVKECGSHYDKDPDPHFYLARPFFAPKSPKPTMPSDPYEQILLTVQQVLFNEVSEEATMLLLQRLQKEAENEHVTMGVSISETQGYKEFQRLLGDNAKQHMFTKHPPTAACIRSLQKAFSQDQKFLLRFMQQHVFRQVAVFEESISSTPQTLLGISNHSCGYTGTLHTGILPPKMKAEAELGTDGKTILAIEQKMQSKVSQVELMRAETPLTDQVIEYFAQDSSYEVFIDSGGWLKEKNVEEFAKNLMHACRERTPPIEGVIMHDKDDKEICLMQINGKWEKIPRERWVLKSNEGKTITIIQQKFETGTNISQRPQAKAFMSIRKNMTLRDTLQSAFRMRRILEGQSVTFGISEEVKEDITLGIFKGLLKHKSFFQMFFPRDPSQGSIETVETYERLRELIPDKEMRIKVYRAMWIVNTKKVAPHETYPAFVHELSQLLTLDSPAIWRYLTTNQGLDQQKKNWLAAKQRMKEVVEKPIRSTLIDPTISLDEKELLFQELEGLFLEKHIDSPYRDVAYSGKTVDSQTAIDHEVAQHIGFFKKMQQSKAISDTTKKLIFEKMKAIYPDFSIEDPLASTEKVLRNCVNIDDIPSVITIGETDSSLEQEIQEEVEQEVEQEVELEEELEQEIEQEVGGLSPPNEVGYQESFPNPASATFCSELVSKSFSSIKTILPNEIASIFPTTDQIYYSRNLFTQNKTLGSLEQVAYQLPGQYVLVITDGWTKKNRYVLVSHHDAGIIEQGLLKAKEKHVSGSMTLVSLSGKVRAKFPDNGTHSVDEHRMALLQAKLMVGNVKLSTADMKLVENMVKQAKNEEQRKIVKQQLHQFILNVIQFLPETKQDYRKHKLRKFLRSGAI